jgi:23S rRNA (cytosine1962-C5)-methyltransferase
VDAGPLLAALGGEVGADAAIFLKERWSRERADRAGRQVAGAPAPPEVEVREAGLRYGLRLCNEEHVDLFLDARDARAAVRERAAGRRTLNLFAYTGAFGVAAAAGGARATTNVDLMRGALAVARANYERNGLPHDPRTFLRDDAFLYLKRAAKGRGRYDLAVLDPPPSSVSRKGRGFQAARDLPDFVRRCALVLDPGALLVVGLNDRRVADAEVPALVRAGLGAAGREVAAEGLIPTPADFPPGSDRPTARFVLVALR